MRVHVLQDVLMVTPDKSDVRVTPTIHQFLREALVLPERFIMGLLQKQTVRIAGVDRLSADTPITAGRKIYLYGEIECQPDLVEFNDSGKSLDVLYEDDHLLVVNKPAGLIIHSDKVNEDSLSKRVANYYYTSSQMRKVLHAHRLDRATTGTVLYAKHGYIARALDAELASRAVTRQYAAYVVGAPLAKYGEINAPIGRDRHISGQYRVAPSGKPARTFYQCISVRPYEGATCSLLTCRLDTGRTHQIRVHMAYLGAPIVGDTRYGGVLSDTWTGHAIALHAYIISFYHPYEQARMSVRAPFPKEWGQWLHTDGVRPDDIL